MQTRILEAEIKLKGTNQKAVAEAIGMKTATFNKKLKGKSPFSDMEKIAVADFLGFTPYQLNVILYDGILPIGPNGLLPVGVGASFTSDNYRLV